MYRVLLMAICASLALSGCHLFHHRPPPQRVAAVCVSAPAVSEAAAAAACAQAEDPSGSAVRRQG